MKAKQALATTILLTVSAMPVYAQTQDTVSLFASPAHVAKSTQEQHFQDQWTLQPSQDKLPLTLTVVNGGSGKSPLNWFRISCNGYLIATEKDLNGKSEGTIDLSGRMQAGTSQLLVDAAGQPGSQMQYWLTTPAVNVKAVKPASATPGQEVVISGNNFSSDESQDAVYLNGKQMQILSAGKTSMTAVVPMNADGGVNKLSVVVNGLKSAEPASITVGTRPQPVLTGTNFWMAPPGMQLILSGSNFAANGSGDKVYFKDVPAKVVSGDSNTITVVVPDWAYGGSQLNIPLTVISNGVRSNAIPIDIGPMVEGQLPPMPGDSSSEGSSEYSSPASSSSASSQATIGASSEASSQADSSSKLEVKPIQPGY